MAVRFILGRSGTGKTRYCTNGIIEALLREDDRPLVLLVPEQASYQAERAILSDGRIRGYSRLSVLSFNRLGFMLLGRRLALGTLSRSGRQMAIEALFSRHRSELKTLGPSSRLPGLARELGSSLIELQQSGAEPEDIDALAAELAKKPGSELSAGKFADIAVIYRHYRQFLAGRFANPDTDLAEARKAVPDAGFLKNARLWVDGFAGFTSQELELLVDVLKVVADGEIAFCLDPEQLDKESFARETLDPARLFYPTECTYAELLDAIRQCRLELRPPVFLKEPHRFASPALALVEKRLFASAMPQNLPADDTIRLLAAPNRRAEAEFAAETIQQLVRSGRYRYRDIAVVATDVGAYRHYIEAAFDDCRIPFFLDVPRRVSEHPLPQLVLSALRAVTEGYAGSHVFAFLKSGLGPLPFDEVNLLENYSIECGIGSADWTARAAWHFAPKGENSFDEARIDTIRRKAVGPLEAMEKELAGADGSVSAEEFTAAVFRLIDTLKVRDRLAGLETKDDDHRRFFDRFVEVFDELVAVFAGMRMAPREYTDVLSSAAEEATLAVIPPRLDQVLVGAIERSRHPDLKAAFLIGCCQSDFPSPLRRDTVMTDDDRLAAEEAGLRLGQTVETQLAARQYLAYIAMTRASQRLTVSWPMADEKGSPLGRSEFVDALVSLMPAIAIESIGTRPAPPAEISGMNRLADVLCAGLGCDPDPAASNDIPLLQGLSDGLRNLPEFAELANLLDRAKGYDNNAALDIALAAQAIGRQMQSSATGLASFAACPYQHFAKYLLRLRPPKRFRFEPLDLGEFYHLVLDRLTKTLLAQGKDFSTIDGSRVVQILHRNIEEVFAGESFLADFRSRSPHNGFILDEAAGVLEQCVTAMCSSARAGGLHTVASELWFGREKEGLPALAITVAGGRTILLKGKIDRLDVATDGGAASAFVFDYKTAGKAVSWSNIYHGLDLQLPLYLLAVEGRGFGRFGELAPGGAFFFPIQTPLSGAATDEGDDSDIEIVRKAYGLFDGRCHSLLDAGAGGWSSHYNFFVGKDGNPYGHPRTSGAMPPDEYRRILAFVKEKVRSLAAGILDGRIEARPYRRGGISPCSHCDFRPLCRFDWQVNEYNFLKAAGRKDIVEGPGGTDG